MIYETDQELFDALAQPFESELIDWRVGSTNAEKTSGLALAYIDARTVMDRLDAACGPGHWQNKYTPAGGMLICDLGIKFPQAGWVWKADGAGTTDVEAEKGMASDALKRAAVRFGLGRYLYEMDSPWVQLEPKGRSYIIKPSERKKLDEIHDQHCLKCGWGSRGGVQAYRLLKKAVELFVTDAATAQEFKVKNKSEIALLPVAMRRHLETMLDRIGATGREMEAA